MGNNKINKSVEDKRNRIKKKDLKDLIVDWFNLLKVVGKKSNVLFTNEVKLIVLTEW